MKRLFIYGIGWKQLIAKAPNTPAFTERQIKKDIFCFKRITISNKPFTITGIENNRNIGGMRYEDQ
ncbi:hypothetical protein ABEP00_08495 [Heyndrickxia sporothermodurans]|uniref:hypothetical protein n=1 Tax=Heyndrickxia sporothermodurans TaxID=46224 RepID=UPI003D23C25E